jgi:hypothetical protein
MISIVQKIMTHHCYLVLFFRLRTTNLSFPCPHAGPVGDLLILYNGLAPVDLMRVVSYSEMTHNYSAHNLLLCAMRAHNLDCMLTGLTQ